MPFRVLSWGCGVQSTTLAVMSALGDLPRLDAVITADTGWERKATYEARDFYQAWLTAKGVSVEVVTAGNIRDKAVDDHIHMPLWTSDGGPLTRECTRYFKVRPVRRRLRELMGYHESNSPHPPADAAELWLGISLDEWTRAKPSPVKFVRHRWPLLELRMTRNDCIAYLSSHDLLVPIKSACIGCPYRSASEYVQMRRQAPDEWLDVLRFDQEIRHKKPRASMTADHLYVRRELRPLHLIDLELAAKHERIGSQLPLLCESGYCMT